MWQMHCGFALAVAKDEAGSPVTTDSVKLMTIKAEKTWWLGLRFMYFLLPAVSWLTGGALGLLTSTALLLAWLRSIDQPPCVQLEQENYAGLLS